MHRLTHACTHLVFVISYLSAIARELADMSGWASFDKTEESKAYQTQAKAHSLLATRSI